MKKVREFFIENKDVIFVGLLIIFVLAIPLMQNDLVIGDDYEYHLSRIESIKSAICSENFPVKIHGTMANNYGYGSGLFYPNLFLYIPANINLIGINLILAYKIFIIICLSFMFTITYFSLKNICENNKISLVGTVMIMVSQTLILNLYHRFALGEFLGYIFITPVISGIYDYVHKEFKHPFFIFVGFFGLINSHLITTLICLIFCILYFLLNIKTSVKNPKKFVKLILIAFLVVMVSACFWMPMLEQFLVQSYKISNPWTTIGNSEYRVCDFIGNSRYSLGMLVSLCIPFILYSILDKNISKKTKIFSILTILICILAVNNYFWKITNEFSNIIQFKWRLIGILTILITVSVLMLIKENSEKFKINLDAIFVFVFIFSICSFNKFIYFDDKINDVKSLKELDKEICITENSIGGGKEYLPIEVEYNTLNNANIAISNTGEKVEVTKTELRCEFTNKNIKSTYFEIPYIYYYGYVANLQKENGEIIPLEVQKSDNGLLKVKITENGIGKISVWYNGTKIQKISYIISGISVIICLEEIWRKSKHSSKMKK